MRIIGHIKTDFRSKFGIPRQSGLVREVVGKIIFEPEFRNVKAIKGLELFSHMWIIWQFSENEDYELLIRDNKIDDIDEFCCYQNDDNTKWLYTLWIAGTEIVDDMECDE